MTADPRSLLESVVTDGVILSRPELIALINSGTNLPEAARANMIFTILNADDQQYQAMAAIANHAVMSFMKRDFQAIKTLLDQLKAPPLITNLLLSYVENLNQK